MNKLEQAARQVLEVMWMIGTDDISMDEYDESQKAEEALREALEEIGKQDAS